MILFRGFGAIASAEATVFDEEFGVPQIPKQSEQSRCDGSSSVSYVSVGTSLAANPLAEYERRRATHEAAVRQLQGRERLTGWLRVAAFLHLFLPLLIVSPTAMAFAVWEACAITAFIGCLFWHRNVANALDRCRRGLAYASRGIDRLNNRWIGQGPTGDRYADAAHPYSSDLDLFGRGSLFQYLCDAHTAMGQDALADWLRAPTEAETIRARQSAIAELRDGFDLREAIGVLGDPKNADQRTRTLFSWPAATPILTGWTSPIIAIVLGVLGIAGVVAWAGFDAGPSPLLFVLLLDGVFLLSKWRHIRKVMRDSDKVLAELNAFLPILRMVESQKFASPHLLALQSDLRNDGQLPSQRVTVLANLLDAWDSAIRNQFVLPLAIISMVPIHLVYAIERWRLSDGRRVRGWLDVAGRFEAICSLATFAYEHPEYPFAEIALEGPTFATTDLAHPLLPADRRVANDLHFGSVPAFLLVSGSNMSGKSTLLRAVGVNALLALAGAPVCAKSLRLSPLAVATAMRQSDSLQEGVSAFYAEIRRLQAIREWTAGPLPVLFLLDEILRGTNSHDRRIGAEAVIKVLLECGAIGLVSTHDLALTEIVERLGDKASNVHFEDQFTEGKLSFDYRLRPGVVPRGNGLVLLRLLGFDV